MPKSSNSKSSVSSGLLIPEEISQEYLRLRNEDGIVASKVFYFKYIMPLIRPWLEEQNDGLKLNERKYSTLVSLMGYSPETTVHSAIILRPKKLIVVYNEDVKASAVPAVEYLLNEKIITAFDLEMLAIEAFNPVNIYDQILAKIPSSENMVFDITGGTKIMSATAGALAWERNLSLCYLNGSWDPQKGAAGLTGTSKLTIFENPSRSRGYRYRLDALASYERGNYISARDRFSESIKLIDQSNFDLLGLQLCDCYGALVDFDREGMPKKINKLNDTLSFGGIRRLYENKVDFETHIDALRKFTEKPVNLMATAAAFTVLAGSYATQRRFDLAGLLSYRAMERFIEIGLLEFAPEFKMSDPKWGLITDDESQLRMSYAKLSSSGKDILPDKVTLISGLLILSVLDADLGERFRNLKNGDAVNLLMSLANKRNRSYLAHGVNNLDEDDYNKLHSGATDLAKAILKDNYAEFELLCSQLRPIELRKLLDNA